MIVCILCCTCTINSNVLEKIQIRQVCLLLVPVSVSLRPSTWSRGVVCLEELFTRRRKNGRKVPYSRKCEKSNHLLLKRFTSLYYTQYNTAQHSTVQYFTLLTHWFCQQILLVVPVPLFPYHDGWQDQKESADAKGTSVIQSREEYIRIRKRQC